LPHASLLTNGPDRHVGRRDDSHPATPAAAPATVAGAATLDTLDAYTGLSFTVPAGLDDQGRAQTCIIDADLFKPHSASALNRVPTILTTNGFGGSKADQSGLGRAFAQRGYAVLPPRVLGSPTRDARSPGRPIHRRRSRLAPGDVPGWRCQGDMRLFANSRRPGRGRHGGCDLQQELDNAAAHDPRVGMIGGSYGGETQFATAAMDPRVNALVPLTTWNDLRYCPAPNNTAQSTGMTYADQTPGTEKIGWSSLFFGVGAADGIQGARIDPPREVGCPNYSLEACRAKATLDALGYPLRRPTR